LKLLDANILLYAYDSASAHHAQCRPWLEDTFNSPEIVAIPWQTSLAFVRIAANPRAVRQPISADSALGIVDSWFERSNVMALNAGERFWDLFKTQVAEAQVSGPLVTDVALAALALECGAILCSTDRDFRRFRGLKLLDPTQVAP
jgi:uncharacterized protein